MKREDMMELSDKAFAHRAAQIQNLGGPIKGSAQPRDNTETEERIMSLALRWFAQMRTGQIDRAQLTAAYNAQLTDDAVQRMSRFLRAYHYGSSPTGAHILRSRAAGGQTFHVVKILFPRGDAASLLFGFDTAGKITGISLIGMAED
jgi:hypothetical protein